jgi:phosphate transport system protein
MDQVGLGQHISQQFNEELEDVRSKVLQMGGMVEEQLDLAVTALVQGNTELAHEVIFNDYRINALDVEIDEECTRIVALRQPAATDLRLVMAVIKTITDLERIGDECKRIARMVQDELDGAMSEDIRQELEHMGELVREMLRMVLDAFARTDVDTAVEVVRFDSRVDSKYVSITRQLMTYMAQDLKAIPNIINILWAARSMERMGDRCENIAEYIFYLVHGRDVRHIAVDDAISDLTSALENSKKKKKKKKK